jgi:hypothetical protein
MIKRAYYFSAWISLLMGLVAASPKTIEKIVASYIEGIAALKTRKAQASQGARNTWDNAAARRSSTMSS